MNRSEALQQLKFLYDQVYQTAERVEHLSERLPLNIHPTSINYERDLSRIEGDYNRLARSAQQAGLLSEQDLEAEGLPLHFTNKQ